MCRAGHNADTVLCLIEVEQGLWLTGVSSGSSLIPCFRQDAKVCHICLQVVATLRALEVAPSTLSDELVGYVKPSTTVVGNLLTKFARLEEDWTVIGW